MIIYSIVPIMKVVEIEILKILAGTPHLIWGNTRRYSGIFIVYNHSFQF